MKKVLLGFADSLLSKEQMKKVCGGYDADTGGAGFICRCVSCMSTGSHDETMTYSHACGSTLAERTAQGSDFARRYCNTTGTFMWC